MEQKLQEIFKFLKENSKFNQNLQIRFSELIMGNNNSPTERLISLLYSVVNTQSQPKIDLIGPFFQKINKDGNCLKSFTSFIKFLDNRQPANFEGLYKGLKQQSGWGPKTSALCTKNIYLIHNEYKNNNLSFWNDVPEDIGNKEKYFLPVDVVILRVFNELDNSIKWNFISVNKKLNELYKNTEIVLWDDLWFWGFFTQRIIEKKRVFEWNENKYWILRETDKNIKTINDIKSKSNDFISIISN